MQPSHALTSTISKLDLLAKIAGGIAAIIAVLAIFLPPSLWRPIEAAISRIYGKAGWVYYEIGDDRKLTDLGNLNLLKVTPTALYKEIEFGDKLRVVGEVNFREGPGTQYGRSFVLITGDCLIVTSTPDHEISVEDAKSGGWLNVVTSPCGLY